MKTIWKFPIEVTDFQVIKMPDDAQILAVQTQHERPCLWAIVDDVAALNSQVRTIEVFGTGHPMDEMPRQYIGTFQIRGGSLVFHVFERS
jgi:hypothetical protein